MYISENHKTVCCSDKDSLCFTEGVESRTGVDAGSAKVPWLNGSVCDKGFRSRRCGAGEGDPNMHSFPARRSYSTRSLPYIHSFIHRLCVACLLYTSDAADE